MNKNISIYGFFALIILTVLSACRSYPSDNDFYKTKLLIENSSEYKVFLSELNYNKPISIYSNLVSPCSMPYLTNWKKRFFMNLDCNDDNEVFSFEESAKLKRLSKKSAEWQLVFSKKNKKYFLVLLEPKNQNISNDRIVFLIEKYGSFVRIIDQAKFIVE